MRNSRIKIFYNSRQVLKEDSATNFSKSPLKPKLVINKLHTAGLYEDNFEMIRHFRPFNENDFKIAHTEKYVHDFFRGKEPLCKSNGLAWSPQFADSVRFTNSSLYHAIKQAVMSRGRDICFSPTSGFHHATPEAGMGFCTFSGQVIASVKLYREFGVSGAYLDLDGHFGNSIEDARKFVPDLDLAIPRGCNINLRGDNHEYFNDLVLRLTRLETMLINDEIQYVVWAHGADSHVWDDLGGQVDTEHWMKCATYFWQWVSDVSDRMGRPIPVAFTLFGGYRKDDYDSVINLHVADIVECLNNVLSKNADFNMIVTEKPEVDMSQWTKVFEQGTSTWRQGAKKWKKQ